MNQPSRKGPRKTWTRLLDKPYKGCMSTVSNSSIKVFHFYFLKIRGVIRVYNILLQLLLHTDKARKIKNCLNKAAAAATATCAARGDIRNQVQQLWRSPPAPAEHKKRQVMWSNTTVLCHSLQQPISSTSAGWLQLCACSIFYNPSMSIKNSWVVKLFSIRRPISW